MTTNKNRNFVLLLRKKGFTQIKLANALAISPPSVNAWVIGKARPSIENVLKMSAILDVDVDELNNIFFGGE